MLREASHLAYLNHALLAKRVAAPQSLRELHVGEAHSPAIGLTVLLEAHHLMLLLLDAVFGEMPRRVEVRRNRDVHSLLSVAEMMAKAKRRAFDAVAVVRLDRLARSTRHLTQLAAELEALGEDLNVVDQGIDTSTTAAVQRAGCHRRVRAGPDSGADEGWPRGGSSTREANWVVLELMCP